MGFHLATKTVKHEDTVVGFIPYIKRQSYINGNFHEDLFQYLLLTAIEEEDRYDQSYAYSTFLHQLIPSRKINYLKKNSNKENLSLNRPMTEDGSQFIDCIADSSSVENTFIKKEYSELIEEVISNLNEEYQSIIKDRFGFNSDNEPLTLKEIGQKHNRSDESIRRKINKALLELQKLLNWRNINLEYFKEILTGS